METEVSPESKLLICEEFHANLLIDFPSLFLWSDSSSENYFCLANQHLWKFFQKVEKKNVCFLKVVLMSFKYICNATQSYFS